MCYNPLARYLAGASGLALARRHGDHSCAVIRRVLRAHAVRCCLARERRALPAAALHTKDEAARRRRAPRATPQAQP